MEEYGYRFFESITKKPDHWTVGDDGELSATFSYVGSNPTKLPVVSIEVNLPTEKDVSFTRKQLQNIHRQLYRKRQSLESQVCNLEIESESDESTASWFSSSSNSADSEELNAELMRAEYAEEIVSEALTMKKYVLEV